MNKKTVMENMRAVLPQLNIRQCETAANVVLQSIAHALARGEDVTLTGFGTFRVARVAERRGRNPATGEPMTIPARKTARFKPCRSLLENMNK